MSKLDLDKVDDPDYWKAWKAERQRTGIMGETSKAHKRRLEEGWYEKYAPDDRSGIDIGCSDDPLNHTFRRWDIVYGDTDATFMEGVPDNIFHTVYCCHILEHLKYPRKAIKRWHDILKAGGHLIILVPHRDLYEKKRFPPSNWNREHTYFWLPDREDPPGAKWLRREIECAVPQANIVSYRVIDAGYDYTLAADEHPVGEFSIEAIVKKSDLAS